MQRKPIFRYKRMKKMRELREAERQKVLALISSEPQLPALGSVGDHCTLTIKQALFVNQHLAVSNISKRILPRGSCQFFPRNVSNLSADFHLNASHPEYLLSTLR